jgi:AraC family transcriptional regulator
VSIERRIQVLEGNRTVPIVAQAPLLSSARIPWDGILLEEHCARAQQTQTRHIHSIFIALHTGVPVVHDWRSAGKPHRTLATKGSVHLLTPGPDRSLTHRDSSDAIVLSIEPRFIDRVVQESQPNEKIELVEHFSLEDPQIERLVRALHAETKAGAPTGRLFGQSIAVALALYLGERYAVCPPSPRRHRGGMPRTRLNRVLEYIEANLSEELSLPILAEVAGMSLYYFVRLFKQSTGLSPHRYVTEQRIKRAQGFLRLRQMTVLEASVRTGFVDQSHFTKVFRRVVGLAPRQYREQTFR